jgi:hypothetical protein
MSPVLMDFHNHFVKQRKQNPTAPISSGLHSKYTGDQEMTLWPVMISKFINIGFSPCLEKPK